VHVLVIPRQHIATLADVQPEHEPLVGHCLSVAAQIARELGVAESGFRLIANTGPNSGMEIAHLHFHVIGGRKLGPMA
jgi:histidine triad (HIT) family protein